MRYLGRMSVAMLVVAGALALAVAGARPAGLIAWDISGNWVGQDEGIYVIHQSGATVTWYAHSPDGKTWAHDFKGTLQGDYIVGNFQDRAGYTNHYNGTIALKITNADHMVWVASYKGVASFPILTRAWTRVPTDLTNQNPFPVSADEQLTVPGNMDATMIRAGSRSGLVAPRRRVIAHAAFRLAPLTTTPARLELSAAGRLLLRKHKVLHAAVTIMIRAAGKPTQSLTRSVSLRAR